MVFEIGYEQYKEFCSKLPCKDVFYFLKDLFVVFPFDNNVYAIKYNWKKTPESAYNELVKNNMIVEWSLSEFMSGLPTTENGTFIKDELYRDKSVVVKL